jgi:hypothetical protein
VWDEIKLISVICSSCHTNTHSPLIDANLLALYRIESSPKLYVKVRAAAAARINQITKDESFPIHFYSHDAGSKCFERIPTFDHVVHSLGGDIEKISRTTLVDDEAALVI